MPVDVENYSLGEIAMLNSQFYLLSLYVQIVRLSLCHSPVVAQLPDSGVNAGRLDLDVRNFSQ